MTYYPYAYEVFMAPTILDSCSIDDETKITQEYIVDLVQSFPTMKDQILGSYYNYIVFNDNLDKNKLDLLISNGFDINIFQDKNIYSGDCNLSNPIIQACEYQDIDILKLLLEQGANIEVTQKSHCGTSLNLCEIAILGNSYDDVGEKALWEPIVEFLVDNGASSPDFELLKRFTDTRFHALLN